MHFNMTYCKSIEFKTSANKVSVYNVRNLRSTHSEHQSFTPVNSRRSELASLVASSAARRKGDKKVSASV